MASQTQAAAYPLRSDYVDALQNPAITLADPALKRGQVDCDRLGFPKPISGAFASVFHVAIGHDEHWAIKCFCQFVPDQERRYHEISNALRTLCHPALVDFEYQQRGILVAGNWYPMLKMRWVDAQGLLPWLEINRFDARRVRNVADQLVTVINDLEATGIAHGDLQHGNLLVDGGNQLRLIDYDGMYVPALAGLPANEKGLANYQPPTRADQHFQPGLDRFSGWVIYASLMALAAAPRLWQLRADGDEKLLFEAADYAQPENSMALQALRDTGDGHLTHLASLITQLARTEVEDMPALDPTGLLGRPTVNGGVPPQRTSAGLPAWMQDTSTPAAATAGVAPPPPTAPRPAADGSWLSEHLPTPPSKNFAGSRVGLIRTKAIMAVMVGVVSALAGPLLAVSPLFGVVVAMMSVVVALTLLRLSYGRHPYYAEARQARRNLMATQGAHVAAQAAQRAWADQRARIDADLQNLRQTIGQARNRLPIELQQATAAAQTTLNNTLTRIARELAAVDASAASRRTARLQQIQEAHIRHRLTQADISKNPPTGIGDQLTKKLAQSGIRTAADFTGFYLTGSSRTRDEKTWLHLTNQQRVHVEGIGPKKAQSLAEWRNNLVVHARQSAPSRLSTAEEQQLQAQLRDDQQRLNQQAAAAKQQAQREQAAAIDRERIARRELDRQEKEANDNAASQRANLDRQLIGVEREVNAKRAALDNAVRQSGAYETITFARYVKYLAAGKG